MNLINYTIVLILTTFTYATAPPIEIVFLIQSQDTKYQNVLSRNLKKEIIRQSFELQPKYKFKVHVLHEIFNYPGGWTIHNLIPQLMLFQQMRYMNENTNKQIEMERERDIINDNTRWIIFCEDTTKINTKLLMEKLNNENHTQPLYLGHALYDREPTIIHHFAFFENPKWFPYPMLRAGVVFSRPLYESIANFYNHNNNNNNRFKEATKNVQYSEFSIDAAHELSRFIYDNIHIPITYKTTGSLKNNKNNKNYSEKPNGHIKSSTVTNSEESSKTSLNGKDFNTDLPHSDLHSPVTIDNDFTEEASIQTAIATNTVTKRQKVILRKASYICPEVTRDPISSNNNDVKTCAMYAQPTTTVAEIPSTTMTCIPIKREEIYFAVKTCLKYQSERVPIILSTWASYAKHVKYFSDSQGDTIPTINTGIPNVEMGHCDKTLQILKLSLKDIEHYNSNYNKNKYQHQQHQHLHYEINQAKLENHQIKWLFLTDDDTLLSVSGVCQVLGCYNSMDDIYLGERYGYRLYAKDGFNYITGGGGIAFSLPVVKLILQHCSCPSPSAPDDMILGSCLHTLKIKALHSSRFHQARPMDYPMELLKLEPPVSFHKFWQLDPLEVYKTWFEAQDNQLLNEEVVLENLLAEEYHSKNRKLLAKPESFNFNDIPVSFVSSLHHSKERHVDL